MKVTEDDLKWVYQQFPELTHTNENGGHIFEGLLCFCMSFDADELTYSHYAGDAGGDRVIRDSYRVRIEIPLKGMPAIRETANRIPPTADRHKYPDSDRACAWGPLDKPDENSSLRDVFSLAIQYFYDQSHFERYAAWPRGEFGHGIIGLLQNYNVALTRGEHRAGECLHILQTSPDGARASELVSSRRALKGHHGCICGSGISFRKCHPDLLQALWSLRSHHGPSK